MSEIVLNDEFDLKEQRFISLNVKNSDTTKQQNRKNKT